MGDHKRSLRSLRLKREVSENKMWQKWLRWWGWKWELSGSEVIHLHIWCYIRSKGLYEIFLMQNSGNVDSNVSFHLEEAKLHWKRRKSKQRGKQKQELEGDPEGSFWPLSSAFQEEHHPCSSHSLTVQHFSFYLNWFKMGLVTYDQQRCDSHNREIYFVFP